MKFKIDRNSLLRPLQVASRAAERRMSMPILCNVRLQADADGAVEATCTDLAMRISARAQGADVEGPGTVTVSAQKLSDIWRSLPDGATVEMEEGDGTVAVRAGGSRFSLATLPVDEFPGAEQNGGEWTVERDVPSSDLCELLDRCSYSMAQEDVRYFLNGMLLELGGGRLRTVATDGHRLSQCTFSLEGEREPLRQAIIPRQTIKELRGMIGSEDEVRIALNDTQVRFENGSETLVSKLIDGRFPDYERVIPRGELGVKLTGDRLALLDAIKRVGILSDEKTHGMRLSVGGGVIKLSARNRDEGEATDEVDVGYEGQEFEVGFNARYLQDALSQVDGEVVEFGMAEPGHTTLIRDVGGDGNGLHVLMPMKL